jgi:hypothetical protein
MARKPWFMSTFCDSAEASRFSGIREPHKNTSLIEKCVCTFSIEPVFQRGMIRARLTLLMATISLVAIGQAQQCFEAAALRSFCLTIFLQRITIFAFRLFMMLSAFLISKEVEFEDRVCTWRPT